MTSHSYDFNRQDLLRVIGWPLLPVVVFALAMHLGVVWRVLPGPRPTLDVDRTLLVHQVEAAGVRQEAEILLLGDSSCLMDVSAPRLGALLRRPVLNLGTHSYLDLAADGELLRRFAAANPGRAQLVVLLLHPEALRRAAPEPYHVRLLLSLLRQHDAPPAAGLRERILQLSGLSIFQGRVLSRLLPAPLRGAYGRFYGFSRDLDAYLTRNLGSAVDPEKRPFQGNAEYRLASQLEGSSASFRAALPPGARLVVGITPVPAAFAGPGYPAVRDRMLRQWGQWLRADAVLDGLPAVLPDDQFMATTHLNETSARTYTESLARALEPHLTPPPTNPQDR